MTIKTIVIEWLEKHGYDGLYNDDNDNCGCGLDDFMPCQDYWDADKCEVAYRKTQTEACKQACEESEDCLGECYTPSKP
jgi:hypothetical protein